MLLRCAVIRLEYDYGVLEQLFVDPAVQNERIGYAAWCAIEALHPEVTVWETAIEFSNKQKIHLYVNCCGFHVTEFFNTHHPDRDGNSLELFRMEKRLPGTPESIQAQIRRITHFETIMQHASDGSPELLKALSDYYSSPAWKRDFASDEVGLLPKDLKRGDLVFFNTNDSDGDLSDHAGLYLGIFGRTVDYADIHTETGDERQPLNRQVAFIPNTLNENWREAIRPAAKLAGGYSYTLTFDNADENVLKAASKVLSRRAGDFAGNADVAVKDGTVVVTVPENAYNSTLAAVFSPMGTIDFVLYGSDGNMSDPVLTSEHVKQAYYYNGGSSPQIQIVFNSKGAKAYNELRAANSGSMLYLRLDSQPVAYASLSALNSALRQAEEKSKRESKKRRKDRFSSFFHF